MLAFFNSGVLIFLYTLYNSPPLNPPKLMNELLDPFLSIRFPPVPKLKGAKIQGSSKVYNFSLGEGF